jgi:hypothetical protein
MSEANHYALQKSEKTLQLTTVKMNVRFEMYFKKLCGPSRPCAFAVK